MLQYDVVIIGGGVVGCALAHTLSRFNGKIALIEKEADIAEGATKANSGIVHTGFDAKPGTLKAKYNVLGKNMYREYCESVGAPYGQPGAMVIGFSEDDHQVLERLYKQGLENGVKNLKIISKEEALEMEPNLNPNIIAALYAEESGITSPYELTYALGDSAALNGVEFFLETQVVSLKYHDSLWDIGTDKGNFLSKVIVNCAGAGGMALHNLISDEPCEITARRGEYYLLDRGEDMPFYMTIFQCPTFMGKGVLITPTTHGNTLLGPTAEDIDKFEDTATTDKGLSDIIEKVKHSWPNYSIRKAITTFSGIRAHSHTDDFIIGEVSGAPMAFEAIGIESPGLTAAPAIAKDLSEQISEALDLSAKKGKLKKRQTTKSFTTMNDEERIKAIEENPQWGNIVCRCETVTEAEIRQAARSPVPARNIDAVKRRTRAGMGRCQGGFCSPRVMEILAEEMAIPYTAVTKYGGKSFVLTETIGEAAKEAIDNEQ